MEQTQQQEVKEEIFEQKAALKKFPKIPKLPKMPKAPMNIDRTKMMVGAIFIISLIVMLALTINSVDVYNGSFP